MNTCEVCDATRFLPLNDSVLFRYYFFLNKENLLYCEKCGAKFMICIKCGNLLNRVHLALDPYHLVTICPSCKHSYPDLEKWIKFGDRIDVKSRESK